MVSSPLPSNFDWLKRESLKHIFNSPILFGHRSEKRVLRPTRGRLKWKSCVTLCDPMDCSPPGSSVHGILQARTLEWVAIPFCRGSSPPRGQSRVSCIAGGFLTCWATREANKGALEKLWAICRGCGLYLLDSLSPQTPVWEFQKGQSMWNTLQGQEEELQGGWQVGDRDGGRANSEGWD